MIGIHIAPHRRPEPDAKLERMRSVPLFADCSPQELAAISQLIDELEVPAGRRLIQEGGQAHEFLVLVEGEAEVRRGAQILRTLQAGDFVGEISLLSGSRRTATVVTTTPARLLVLTDRAFARIVEGVPGLSLKVMRTLAERLPSCTTAAPGLAA